LILKCRRFGHFGLEQSLHLRISIGLGEHNGFGDALKTWSKRRLLGCMLRRGPELQFWAGS
jgi:hypothetical protein